MSRTRLPADVERRLRDAAQHRCGYCLSPQHLVFAPLEIEHLTPRSQGSGDEEENLWLSCPLCNAHKSNKTFAVDSVTQTQQPLFNPRVQNWHEHFRWSQDGLRIIGITPVGRATVTALHLDDDPIAIEVRSHWVAAGWHPPAGI